MKNFQTAPFARAVSCASFLLLFFSTSVFAQRFFDENYEFFDKNYTPLKEQEELAARVDRENWARIVTSGGRIFAVRDVYGCTSLEAYGEIMSFIMYGTGSMPSPDECWKLENRVDVELTDSVFPLCNDTQTICKFKQSGISGWASSPFYTTVFAISGK